MEVEWDTVADLRYGPSDTTLVNPIHIRVNDLGIWLNDPGAQRIVLLDTTGAARWFSGRQGSGPGEFRNVRDIEFLDTAKLGILDPANGRITVLGGDGEVLETIDVGNHGHAEEFAVLADGSFILVTLRPDSPLVHVDSRGSFVERYSIAWPRFAKLHSLASQNHTVVGPDRRYWVLGLAVGEVFMVFGPSPNEATVATYVEWTEAPDIGPPEQRGRVHLPLVPFSGINLAVTGDTILVLFGGKTEHRGRLLDAYSATTGAYLTSYVLPARPLDLSVHRGVFYLLLNTPNPRVLVLRPS